MDFWPPWDQYKSGEKVDQYVGGYAFYKHPKMAKNSRFQPRKFTARIHPVYIQQLYSFQYQKLVYKF